MTKTSMTSESQRQQKAGQHTAQANKS